MNMPKLLLKRQALLLAYTFFKESCHSIDTHIEVNDLNKIKKDGKFLPR